MVVEEWEKLNGERNTNFRVVLCKMEHILHLGLRIALHGARVMLEYILYSLILPVLS